MKHLRFLFVGIILAMTLAAFAQEVVISVDHPSQVRAGQEFTVSLNIDKGALTDYSRFSQDLPAGLTASNVDSPNADFSFDNQRVRIIWLKMPESDRITVSYRIMVDEHLKGSFQLSGVFAYVVEDVRKFLNLENQREISIIPNATVDPTTIVDIHDFKAGAAVAVAAVPPGKDDIFAMAVRQVPDLQEKGDYLVHLLIKNPDESKYIKIEESVPAGYIFEEVNAADGIVSHTAASVKFIWMMLPDRPEFEISYRLSPKANEPQSDMSISGTITYTAANENITDKVKQMDVNLASMNSVEKRELLLGGTIPAASAELAKPPVVEEKPVIKEAKPTSASGQMIMDTKVLESGSGVQYSVQLIAKRKPFNANSYFRKAGLSKEVFVEKHEGLYKYTTGFFSQYADARAYSKQLANAPEGDPFVVAYKDGKRVPISTVR